MCDCLFGGITGCKILIGGNLRMVYKDALSAVLHQAVLSVITGELEDNYMEVWRTTMSANGQIKIK
jgi:hypothetical protein